MKMPTFQPTDKNIPVRIRRAFAQGKIASAYEEIFNTASKLAVTDTIGFRAMKLEEYFDLKQEGDEGNQPHLTDVIQQMQSYAQQRFDYHLENMLRMVELRAGEKK